MPRSLPIALAIAGSDSGGGAGIQADLKTFAALGVHGTSAITCLTAQTPRGVTAIQAARPAIVRAQIEAVFAELRPAAVKTGMLFDTATIRAVADYFGQLRGRRPPLIVDPVMVATSGARLLRPAAVRALLSDLLPLATLVTPNLDEAEILVGTKLTSVQDLRAAARTIHRRFGCAALVKGGHLRGLRDAVDIFFDGKSELLLSAPFVRGVSTHGTGCTYSAAIAAHCAHGHDLPRAVQLAKDFITQAITHSHRAGKHSVLNPFAGMQHLSRNRADGAVGSRAKAAKGAK
ncbi:MAG: bifunctional hydroxymethylpyrimidine kinase/phosphomethylpyrimidine kinase [Verrucomicrobia bacterium]|nr:bifunctional hydroxymethylpyrimidine kinase/phosphomethylpyrimidine kinase [Verrucomicrobiota bacterium]